MANSPFSVSGDPTDTDDILYQQDSDQKYLGHEKAIYGFILQTTTEPREVEYIFEVNPQSIQMREPNAVSIQPTQGGGKFIENQGNIEKELVISGTTGFLPLKSMRKPGTGLLAQNIASKLPSSSAQMRSDLAKVSGYHRFHVLRSMFRRYAQIHRNGTEDARKGTFLYWLNMKDDEVWLVEPNSFDMQRVAPKNTMTYSYTIVAKTVAKGSSSTPVDPSAFSPEKASAFQVALTNIATSITEAVGLLDEAAKSLQQFRNMHSYAVELIDIGTQVAQGIKGLAAGASEVLEFPRSILSHATTTIENLYSAAADSVFSLPLGAIESSVRLKQDFDHLLARTDLFHENWAKRWDKAIKDFATTYGIQGDASDFLAQGVKRDAVVEGTPQPDETIYDFSYRMTGDASRASEIIILNGLRWPYFSPSPDQRLPGTVAPGDPVLVPTTGNSNSNDNLITNNQQPSQDRTDKDEVASATSTTLTKLGAGLWRVNQWKGYVVEIVEGTGTGQIRLVASNTAKVLTVDTPWTVTPNGTSVFKLYFKRLVKAVRRGIEELLGTDILIVYNDLSKTWDFAKNSRGGIQAVSGVQNFDQALTIKFMTTPGDLILHPWFGLRPIQGTKGSPEFLFRARFYFEQTILSDSRVEALRELRITQDGDTYRTTSKVALKGGASHEYGAPLK